MAHVFDHLGVCGSHLIMAACICLYYTLTRQRLCQRTTFSPQQSVVLKSYTQNPHAAPGEEAARDADFNNDLGGIKHQSLNRGIETHSEALSGLKHCEHIQ